MFIFFFTIFQSPEPSGIIDLRSYHVAEGNYTKRKHVFKLTSVPIASSPIISSSPVQASPAALIQNQPQSTSTPSSSTTSVIAGTELLIQADSNQDMKLWMDTLRKVSCMDTVKNLVSILYFI